MCDQRWPGGGLVPREGLTAGRHGRADAGDVAAGQQAVPVELLEGQLAQVVQAGLAEQRQAQAGGIVSGERLGVVVEVDQQGLAGAGLDEAVGVAVESGGQRLPGQEAADIAGQDVALEVGDGTRLGRRHVGRVAQGKHIGLGCRLERARVNRDEAEFVTEPGRVLDIGGPAVQRDDHGQVERHHALVIGDQPACRMMPRRACPDGARLDGAGVELGHQVDALVRQQAAELLIADGFGEGAIQGRDVGQVHPVADAPLAEVIVGQEAELQRRDRAFNRHVDHVDYEPAAAEPLERAVQGHGTVGGVESEDVAHPPGTGEPFGLPGQQARTGGDHQDVVAEHGPVIEMHAVSGHIDVVHPGLPEGDTGMQLPLSGTDKVSHVGPAERHEQQPGLIHMVAVAVHHDNLGLVRVIGPPEPVGGQRAAGAPAQDHDSLHKIIFVNGGWPGERHWSCAWGDEHHQQPIAA